MPNIFPGSALVDIYLELQGKNAFQEEYQYLIESQEGTPLGRFFEILNEADDGERIEKLKDFFLDYHIPFPKDNYDYFVDFKYQNLKSNRELQIVLDLYCYAYEKCMPNIVDYEKERENLQVIREQLKEEEMDYVVLGDPPTMEEEKSKTELNKEKLRYYINKVHMQDESQIVPHYKELLEGSIGDYKHVEPHTIENFLSMMGTIEIVAPIIGAEEVNKLLSAMDFTELGEDELRKINALKAGIAKSILQDKVKKDRLSHGVNPNLEAQSLEESINNYKDSASFVQLIKTIEKVAPIMDPKEVRKLLLAIDFTRLRRSEIEVINKLKDGDDLKTILQDKIKEDKVIKEARLILKTYPRSQAAKDISYEIYALSVRGDTVSLTTACKNALQKHKGDKGAYKKEILKLCAPKVRKIIRKSLEEIEQNLEAPVSASRRPNIIGYARQLFQRFQGQRSQRELEIGQESDAKLKEAKSELVAISDTVVQSVNEEYGLASTYFREVIKQVKEKGRDNAMYKADTLANDPLVKTGDFISANIPLEGERDQVVINSFEKYCLENKNTPLVEVIDIVSGINTLVGLTRQVDSSFLNYKKESESPEIFLEQTINLVNSYAEIHDKLVSKLRETKYANLIPRLEGAKAKVDAILLAIPSDRNSQRHTLR